MGFVTILLNPSKKAGIRASGVQQTRLLGKKPVIRPWQFSIAGLWMLFSKFNA